MKSLKLVLLLAVIGLFSSQVFAQAKKTKPGISAGVLGAVNLTQFRMGNPKGIDYKTGTGWAAGVWFNLPLTQKLSFEPQAQWSVLKYVGNNNPPRQFAGTIQYQSFPLLFKYTFSKDFSVIAGPQIDFNNSLKNDNTSVYYKRDFLAISTAATAGVELFTQRKVQLYGRYIYGITDMKTTQNFNANKGNIQFYNTGFQFGLKVKLYEKKIAPPPPPPPPPAPVVVVPKDTDGDGVIDDNDKCPSVKGLAKYQGCPIPDTDKDGINDEQDKCPTVAGLAKYQGCPIPDTDKDAINDEEDKCATVAGLARYQGCPIPDTDQDGVNDEEDKCPTVKGTVENNGCPELKKQYNFDNKKILFVTGSSVLTKASKVELGKVIKAMNDYPSLKLYVDGYTDNTGSDKINKALSLKRATSVKSYLFAKKIAADRLLTEGKGSESPIADNKTVKGRAENRRVEFRVREID
jgi:outer membrane protein OmpA-like peptidoglycan-associated protein